MMLGSGNHELFLNISDWRIVVLFPKRTFYATWSEFSPNSVSALRGSYGTNKRTGLDQALT